MYTMRIPVLILLLWTTIPNVETELDKTESHNDYEEEVLSFSKHLVATKYWFTRISFANKKRYVLALLNDVKSAWTLSLLLKAMWNCRPKDAVLSISETNVWSSYDQVPMDHNRTAQPVKTLAQVMTSDRKWFHSLDPESQAMVLSELVTAAGGPVMWEVLRRAQVLYHRYRDCQLKNLLECIVVVDEHGDKKNATPNKTDPGNSITNVEHADKESTETSKQPQGQAKKQLETLLTAWNARIKTIRDSQKLEEVEMTFNDGTKRKIWKVNRPKPEGIETVDFIQLLPAVIGKRILSFLPANQLNDYARVNKYWAYLVEEYRLDVSTRQKLNNDLDKLKDLMLKHDTSMDVLAQPEFAVAPSSLGTSVISARLKREMLPSTRPSEKSTGGLSFRHFVDEKLKPEVKKQKPIRNMAELSERLKSRGAADEHLWLWCENVLKQDRYGRRVQGKIKQKKEQAEEGVLRFKDTHFPCPLMKRHISLPLGTPLYKDPSVVTSSAIPRLKRNISNATLNMPQEEKTKRYHLWSRDFSSLYKVFKVASYQYPMY